MTQVLVSNATFYHLSCKRTPVTYVSRRRGFHEDEDRRIRVVSMLDRDTVKPGGDRFETVVAEYFQLRGFDALVDWMSDLFDTLITAAWKAVLEW
jgi:hypothetical protein